MTTGSIDTIYASIIDALTGKHRIMVGIAGPPGVGKSTLSTALSDRLNQADVAAAIVPMDGFHLDNKVLRQRGLLQRKGAPQTFDAEGFISLAETLRTSQTPVAVPIFDRETDQVISAGETISASTKVILLEGNYLLLDRAPWTRVSDFLDLSVFVTAPQKVLRDRLIQRWLDLGYDASEAEWKASENDIPNAELVLDQSIPADVNLGFKPRD